MTFGADYSNIDNPLPYGRFLLYQTGRRILASGESVPEHTHRDFFELTHVRSGEGVVSTNGKMVRVLPGDIYISFGGDFHAIDADGKKPMVYDYLAFSVQDAQLSCDVDWLVATFCDAQDRIIRDDRMDRLLPLILEERRGGEAYHGEMMETLLSEVFCLVLRAFHKRGSASPERELPDEVTLCYEMMNYIDTHIYHIRTLVEVADAMNYNYNYLSNLYKRVMGITLLDYYRQRKLKTARLLLSEEGATVSKVAALLGYSSLYTFSRAFKEMYGVAPSRAHTIYEDDDGGRTVARLALARAHNALSDAENIILFDR